MPAPGPWRNRDTPLRWDLLAGILLPLVTVAIYAQVRRHGYISLDDALYVTENPRVLAGLTREGVVWAFRSTDAANWHPLAWLSHMLDVELFGVSPGAHHLVNVAFHAGNGLLLFTLLRRITGNVARSAAAAALFAFHPLRVESVAWVAERKDVLSVFFTLLAVRSYVGYARKPSVAAYLPVPALYGLSLMAKAMPVTLPVLLLLLDVWPLRRLEGMRPAPSESPGGTGTLRLPDLLREKVPLALMAAGVAAIAYASQEKIGAVGTYPPGVRAGNAAISYLAYLWKTVYPANLSVFYPHPGNSMDAWRAFASFLAVAGVSGYAILRYRDQPALFTGWFWFLVSLLPVIGLVQIGGQGMADRYTYLPSIGLSLLAAYWLPDRWRRFRVGKYALVALFCSLWALLPALAWSQAALWRDSVTLFSHSLRVTRGNWMARDHLGWDLHRKGKLREAIEQYRMSLAFFPENPVARNHLGVALAQSGKPGEAVPHLLEAVRIKPDYAVAHYNLGVAFRALGDIPRGAEHIQEATRLDPDGTRIFRGNVAREGVEGRAAGSPEGGRVNEEVRPGVPP